MKPKLVVPYARNRIAYAVLKSLAADVDCYMADSLRLAMCRVSRYAKGFRRYPTTRMEFINWAKRQLSDRCFVFPTFEEAWVLREAGMLKEILPDTYTLRKAGDKAQVAVRCKELGIPAPETHFIYDAVLKPVNGRGSRGRQYVTNCLYQRRVSGPGIGVGLLFLDGEVMAKCCWQRLSEYTSNGGWSVVRESIRSPIHEERAEALMKGLGWSVGACMVEFKGDAVLEVNPRLWGSLQLSIDAGVDFPRLMWDIITTGDCRRVLEWRTGVVTSYVAGCLASHHWPQGNLEDWSRHDPLPFFMQFLTAGANLLRHRRLALDVT